MIPSSHQIEVGDVMANYYTPFSLRVSEELLDKVKQLAAAHKRSANKEIEFALERLETVMTEAGELQKEDWVDFTQLVDNSYADKAAAQLG